MASATEHKSRAREQRYCREQKQSIYKNASW